MTYAFLEKPDRAKKDFEAAVKFNPKDKFARLFRAFFSAQAERFVEVMKITKEYPDWEPGLRVMSHVCCDNDKVDLALEYVNKAIASDGDSPTSYYIRGKIHMGLNNLSLAAKDLERALSLDPLLYPAKPAEPYIELANALSALGRMKQALAYALMARRLQPSSIDAEYAIYTVYFRMRKFCVCRRLAEEMIRSHPDEALSHVAVAFALNGLHKHSDALKAAEKAVEMADESETPYIALGRAYGGLGRYGEALDALNKGTRAAAESGHAKLEKMEFLAACPNDDFRDGKRAKEMSLRLKGVRNEKNPVVLRALAIVHAECGEWESAIDATNRALKLVEGNVEFAAELEKLLGKFKEKRPYRLNDSERAK